MGAKEGALVVGAAVGSNVGDIVGSDVRQAWCWTHIVRSKRSRSAKFGTEM